MLYVDFETRSFCDLIAKGGYTYAKDATTQVTMMAFVFGGDPDPEIWIPLSGDFWDKLRTALKARGHTVHKIFPQSINQHIDTGGMIAAHNAQFERLNFTYGVCPTYGVPEIPLEQYYCTAAQARANNMPADLEGCAKALGADQQKDHRGKQLIQTLCVPHDGEFVEDLDLYVEFAEYCIQDARTERSISKAMRALTARELDEYVASEIVNDRGLMVDTELAAAAVSYADDEQADLITEIINATNGAVKKCRGKTLTNWIYARLPEPQQKHMHKYKDGARKISFDRTARERIILDPDTPPLVRDVAEFSDFAQASSTGKFKAMLERADPEDERVRGAYIFNGAASTGRYSSKGLQTHNFPRDSLKDPDLIADMLCAQYDVGGIERASGHSLMQTLKRLLRHSIIAAPGHIFVCGDWSQIEGRGAPWLSMGTNRSVDVFAQQKLDAYANQTEENDVYCQTASEIYGFEVRRDGSKKMEDCRQIGKVAELALQFLGGKGAFQSMAHNYGVHVSDDRAEEIKVAWRRANPWAETFGNALFDAACNAVRHRGQVYPAGRVQYFYHPDILKGALLCLLPCGRLLTYPDARLDIVDGKFGPQRELTALKSNWKPKVDEPEWPRVRLWRGLLLENIDQGTCASLLRDTLSDLIYDYDAPVAGHTHDELLLEVAESEVKTWHGILDSSMLKGRPWAEGLPLAATVWTGYNFRK